MNRPLDAEPGVGLPLPPADGPKDRGDLRSPRERMTTLVEEMLAYRANPGVSYTFFRFPDLAPQELLTRLKDEVSLGLLVPDGERLPQPARDDVIRIADSNKLTGVIVTADRAREGNFRRRKVGIEFLAEYEGGDRIVKTAQKLILEDDSKEPVRITMRRSALVDLNSEEGGYDSGKAIPVSDEQATGFLGILEELFEAWKKSPEGIDRAKRKHVASHLSKTP